MIHIVIKSTTFLFIKDYVRLLVGLMSDTCLNLPFLEVYTRLRFSLVFWTFSCFGLAPFFPSAVDKATHFMQDLALRSGLGLLSYANELNIDTNKSQSEVYEFRQSCLLIMVMSGVRLEILETTISLLNSNNNPCLLLWRTITAFGNQVPFLYIVAILITHPNAKVVGPDGKTVNAAEAFRLARITYSFFELEPQERLALVNGTAVGLDWL